MQAKNPIQYQTINPKVRPSQQDIEAANSVYLRDNVAYAGVLFQYTGTDRFLWNALLGGGYEFTDSDTVGPVSARLAGEVDIHIIKPVIRSVTEALGRPKPTKIEPCKYGIDDGPSAA